MTTDPTTGPDDVGAIEIVGSVRTVPACATTPTVEPAYTVETVEIGSGRDWIPVCGYADLTPGRGVAVLVDGEQIALFRDRAGDLYALANRDPFSGAYVISRGIVGRRGDVPTVASPMYKQVFDLRTGVCLDRELTPSGADPTLRTWPVRLREPAIAQG